MQPDHEVKEARHIVAAISGGDIVKGSNVRWLATCLGSGPVNIYTGVSFFELIHHQLQHVDAPIKKGSRQSDKE